jgi:predicted pyridoxine 5'-phosphate oxidase superfamily flavin-nucleotide-binding protein
MARNFGSIAFTPKVKAEQEKHGSLLQYVRMTAHGPDTNRLGPAEREFIEARDGLYMATVSETGWPYVQFRGGPAGFLKVLDEQTIGFADFRGNRQYITVANLKHDGRVALFLMDYPNQTRLKILGRAQILEGQEANEALSQLKVPGYAAKIERAIVVHLEAFDWNCQQHIIPRYNAGQIHKAIEPLQQRIQALEEENRRLRAGVSNCVRS